MADYILKKGVKYLSVYCFSTENFKREASEVDYLMNLFISEFRDSCKELKENNMSSENLYYFATKEEAIENLDKIIKENDTILVKASRGMHLEKVVEHLNK